MKTTMMINVPQALMVAIVEAGLDQFSGLMFTAKVTEVESGSGYSRSSEFKITLEIDLPEEQATRLTAGMGEAHFGPAG